MRVKILFFVLALVYTAALAYFSLINLSDTSASNLQISDKVMHTGAYFILALLWLFYFLGFHFSRKEIIKILQICVLCIVFGIFVETLQGWMTTYRDFDFFDIIANTLGITAAGLLYGLLNLKGKPKEQN